MRMRLAGILLLALWGAARASGQAPLSPEAGAQPRASFLAPIAAWDTDATLPDPMQMLPEYRIPPVPAADPQVWPARASALPYRIVVVSADQIDQPSQLGRKSRPGEGEEERDLRSAEEASLRELGKLPPLAPTPPPWYTVHAQATVVDQGYWPFASPYSGANSLPSATQMRLTTTATLYFAAKLWQGGSLIINPEVAGGGGIGGTTGIADFPNGEAVRTGVPQPIPYFARFELQQVFELGGEWERLQDAPNQLPGPRYKNNIILKVGKMPATDDFDDNRFAHDPRTEFLNWGLLYNPTWDYPANVRGYTYGGTAELNVLDWSWRYGVFAEPASANGAAFDPHILKANGNVFEFEQRWFAFNEQPGAARWMAYENNAHMGNYRVALRDMPVDPDITQTRAYRVKYGFGLSWDQGLTKELGIFGRLGWDDGHTEAWAYAEADQTASLGAVLRGKSWGRPNDEIGVASVVSGLSTGHRDYLRAGGLGFIIGDGKLVHYGAETVVETYYNLQLRRNINFTLDFQEIVNPAYNRDRGPVSVLAVRLHMEY
jgi:high affinity Mn2+ porin